MTLLAAEVEPGNRAIAVSILAQGPAADDPAARIIN
jgi:hypothetical protein